MNRYGFKKKFLTKKQWEENDKIFYPLINPQQAIQVFENGKAHAFYLFVADHFGYGYSILYKWKIGKSMGYEGFGGWSNQDSEFELSCYPSEI